MTSRSVPNPATRVVAALAIGALLAACSRREAAAAPDSARAATAPRTPDAALRALMADAGQWASYGRDYTNQRYSPLTQLTTANVAQLAVAWHYKTGLRESFEASPLVVGRTLYLTTPMNHLVALDAATGRRKWEYVHPLGTTTMCCGPVNRGAAYYGGRVYMATLDAQLVALDTADGHLVWHVQVADNRRGYSITHAPVIVQGKVLVGLSGAEYGIRGRLTAYDAASGAVAWTWNAIPSPAEGGWWGRWAETDPFGTPLHRNVAQEKRDSAKYPDAWKTGGGSIWQAPAIDTARGLVILTANNASPDVDGVVRPGDNLYTNCIVALDVATGKLRWYFQEVPHDTWDYDAISPPVLIDVPDSTGAVVPAVAQAGKTGWVYVVRRDTGKPIRRSEAFVEQQHMFTPATREGVHIMPGANGGSEWSPTAYSPQTGYLYVLGLNEHDLYKLRPEKLSPPASWLSGVWFSTQGSSGDNGTFTAIDLATGRIAWQDTLPHPMIGGALATAGGLVFVGTTDRRVLAVDARTGRILWTYTTHGGVNAPPITYLLDGRQYVAVAAGGNFQINTPRDDELLVFALPRPGLDTSATVVASPGSASAGEIARR